MTFKDTFTAEVPKAIKEDDLYTEWEQNVDGSLLVRVMAMQEKITSYGIITNVKDLREGLYEKKWNSGLRVYFAVIIERDKLKTLLLLGSGKGQYQNKTIMQSRNNLNKYLVYYGTVIKKD